MSTVIMKLKNGYYTLMIKLKMDVLQRLTETPRVEVSVKFLIGNFYEFSSKNLPSTFVKESLEKFHPKFHRNR